MPWKYNLLNILKRFKFSKKLKKTKKKTKIKETKEVKVIVKAINEQSAIKKQLVCIKIYKIKNQRYFQRRL